MEMGRFWNILDRFDPSSPFGPQDAIRARLSSEIESLLAAAENESFEDGVDSVLSMELQRLCAATRRVDSRDHWRPASGKPLGPPRRGRGLGLSRRHEERGDS